MGIGLPGLEALQPGDPDQIGPYRLLGVLGSGGFGRVFLGQSADSQLVAVKVIRPDRAADREFRLRFRREAAAARKVSGRFTAQVIDADVDGPTPWLATAYIAGPSLADAVATHGPLPVSSVLALATGLTEALVAIHAAGLVHRDLKPSNVLLAEDGPRVIDFGIARPDGESTLTSTGVVIGTFAFMSPEQALGGKVGPPSDVFSLGSVLVFAATGRGPFGTGPDAQLLYRVAHEPPSLDQVPQEVRLLAQQCLERNAAARPTPSVLLDYLGDARPAAHWLPEPITRTITKYMPPPGYPLSGNADRFQSGPAPVVSPVAPPWSPSSAATLPRSLARATPSPPALRQQRQVSGRLLLPGRLRHGLIAAAVVVAAAAIIVTLIENRQTWIGARGTAWVTSSAGLVPVNLATGHTGRAIAVGNGAYLMAFKPGTKTAYVTDIATCRQCTGSSAYRIIPINLATGRSGKEIKVGSETFQIAITPDGKTAYITNDTGVVPISLATGHLGKAIKVGNIMSRIAITPDGQTAYVTYKQSVVPINLNTSRTGTAIDLGHSTGAIAITPDGATAYVYDSAGVVPINLATGHPGKLIQADWIEGENGPGTITITPNGKTAYVSAQAGIVPINLVTNRPGALIGINDLVQAISIAPNGEVGYVGGWSGAVYPIRLATGEVGKAIAIGGNLQDVAIAP